MGSGFSRMTVIASARMFESMPWASGVETGQSLVGQISCTTGCTCGGGGGAAQDVTATQRPATAQNCTILFNSPSAPDAASLRHAFVRRSIADGVPEFRE